MSSDWFTFTPTAAGFTALLAYVIFVTNTFYCEGPNGLLNSSLTVLHRESGLKLTLNNSFDPCTQFWDHVCHDFYDYYPLSFFDQLGISSRDNVRSSTEYKTCLDVVDFDVADTVMAKRNSHTLVENLVDGFNVNGVVMRVMGYNGTYLPYLFTDILEEPGEDESGEEPKETTEQPDVVDNLAIGNVVRCPCLGYEVVVFEPDICSMLCDDEQVIKLPSDFPCDCMQATSRFRLNATSFFVRKHYEKLEAFARETDPNVPVFFGGGPGKVTDTEFQTSILNMWMNHQRKEAQLLNTTVIVGAWPGPAYTVNALYSHTSDSVFIFDGLLKYPFYSDEFSNELMMGGLGFIIAHELGHARDYRDNNTILGNALIRELEIRAHTTKHVAVTVHEDIADFYAMQTIDAVMGRTAFYQLAQLWCTKNTVFKGDVHAPGKFRINETTSHSSTFKKLFCMK